MLTTVTAQARTNPTQAPDTHDTTCCMTLFLCFENPGLRITLAPARPALKWVSDRLLRGSGPVPRGFGAQFRHHVSRTRMP
ncbi:hypothetical protein SRIMM317S_01631 [Streptomyces rimosus subsp. rimosus]